MLPLTLLSTAQGHPVVIELKNGEAYNGHLAECDPWMNVILREVICTASDGDNFWRQTEAYIRGNTIRCIRLPEEIIDIAKNDPENIRTKDSNRRTQLMDFKRGGSRSGTQGLRLGSKDRRSEKKN